MSRDEKAAVLERLREFDRVADSLDMPRGERLGILNLSEDEYLTLRSLLVDHVALIRPELERRLTYALPLMRRLASNTAPTSAAPTSRTTLRAC